MDFRYLFFPYCLLEQQDGSYAVVNRRYKPLGFTTQDWVNYEDHPILITTEGLGPKTIKKLSYKGSTDSSAIYLYGSGHVPTSSKKNMDAYQKRLALLAKLKIKPVK
ncbi:MAG: hypothetical protein KZQ76_01190 [Candidatus Thiodiazotropha sp. (ex Epidulcina cf. delphinae)]|nr:hypothetical protein [Candidatus Thiodiazotropha sp. (ex Epidulcina cf. delphinae)]